MSPALLRVLAIVDRGFCHSLSRSGLTSKDRKLADELVAKDLLRVARRRGRFPKRLVVTSAGSWALGTFDMSGDLDREIFFLRRAKRAA